MTNLAKVGRVYFISDGDHVKIGWTDLRLATRLSSLQCGNVRELRILGSLRGSRELEWRLHTVFEEYRVRGEWFKITGRLSHTCKCLEARQEQRTTRKPIHIIPLAVIPYRPTIKQVKTVKFLMRSLKITRREAWTRVIGNISRG